MTKQNVNGSRTKGFHIGYSDFIACTDNVKGESLSGKLTSQTRVRDLCLGDVVGKKTVINNNKDLGVIAFDDNSRLLYDPKRPFDNQYVTIR